MKLYLAEHKHQVIAFLQEAGAGDNPWVALGPSAMHYLEKMGIPFSIPEDYLSQEEIEAACVGQFERLTSVCRELDNLLAKDHPLLGRWGIRPFFFHLWQLGQLADILLSRAMQLQKILEHFPDAEVQVHLAPPQPWAGFGLGFGQQETLWGRLLTLPGWNVQIRTRPQPIALGRNGKDSALQTLLSSFYGFLSRLSKITPGCETITFSLRQGWWKNILNIWQPLKITKKSSLVMLNGLYEWAGILPDLMQQGAPCYFVSGKLLARPRLSVPTNSYRSTLAETFCQTFQKGFLPGSVDFSPLLQNRVAFIAEQGPAIAEDLANRLSFFLRNKDIRALLFSVTTNYPSYIVSQYCRRNQIRILCWQHGAAFGDKGAVTQRTDLLNLTSCDQMLVSGEAVKRAYEGSPLATEEGCEIIAVGMPSLEPLKGISPSSRGDKMRVLWVFGGYYGNGWYCGFSPPTSDRLYYQEQMVILKDLIDLLGKFSQIEVTVKLYSSSYLTDNPPWVQDLKDVERLQLVYNHPNFVDLLPQHDLVIIDSPTTTLLQAVATRLPVFVSMSVIRWPDAAIDLLKKRAPCWERAELLMAGVRQFIESGQYPGDVEDREFLKYYGVCGENGLNLALKLTEQALNGNQIGSDNS